MYIFEVKKSNDSTVEEFESAINCAKNCIESVLDDQSISVIVNNNCIAIASINSEQKINIKFSECKEKVKGCFCNASGQIYPEFSKIEPYESNSA